MVSASLTNLNDSTSSKEMWDRLSQELPWKLHDASPEDLACFWRSRNHLNDNVRRHLQKWVSIKAPNMEPRQLSNIALLAAKADIKELLSESGPFRCSILAKLPEFWELDLGQTCFAFGKLRRCDEAILTAISERLLALDFRVKMDTLAAAIYCYSRCGFSSTALLSRLWSRVTLDTATDAHLLMLLTDSISPETSKARALIKQRLLRQSSSALVQLLVHFTEFSAHHPGFSDDDFLRSVLVEVKGRSDFSPVQRREMSRLLGLVILHKMSSAQILKSAASIKRSLSI